jgi:hypothetical protein
MLILSNVFVLTTLPTVSADHRENICPTVINPTIANQSKYIDIDVGWFNITVYDDDKMKKFVGENNPNKPLLDLANPNICSIDCLV